MRPVAEDKPERVRDRDHIPVAKPVASCYRCGAALPPEHTHCPRCGRPQYRVCYCGYRIPINAGTCPVCQADWSSAYRVRKKAHSRKVRPQKLGRYALAGAGVAVIVALLANVVVTVLASSVLVEGQSLPSGIGDRLGLALQGAGQLFHRAYGRLLTIGGGLAPVLGVGLVGAAIGALVYLVRAEIIRIRLPGSRRKHKRRRRAQ